MLLSLAVAAVLIVGIGFAAVLTTLRRRTALRRLAQAHGWRWTARDDDAFEGLTGRPFGRASGRRAVNVVRGAHRGRPVLTFDYSWMRYSSDGQGRQRSTIGRVAVCVVTLLEDGGEATVVPRRVPWARGRLRVKTDDPVLAQALAAVPSLLRGHRLHVRVEGDRAWCWRPGLHTADTLLAQLDALSDVADVAGAQAAGRLAG